jgi:hypothetical protein
LAIIIAYRITENGIFDEPDFLSLDRLGFKLTDSMIAIDEKFLPVFLQ